MPFRSAAILFFCSSNARHVTHDRSIRVDRVARKFLSLPGRRLVAGIRVELQIHRGVSCKSTFCRYYTLFIGRVVVGEIGLYATRHNPSRRRVRRREKKPVALQKQTLVNVSRRARYTVLAA